MTPPASTFDLNSVLLAKDERERQRAMSADAAKRKARTRYVALLQKGELTTAEADELLAVMDSLGGNLDPAKDAEVLSQLAELRDRHDRIEELSDRYVTARENHIATEKRCAAEVDAAERAARMASAERVAASSACSDALTLARAHPHLFNEQPVHGVFPTPASVAVEPTPETAPGKTKKAK